MKTILVVDDQLEVRELVEVTLNIGSYRILKAANGESALEIARAEKPDLIILDVMMPGGMDGYHVCEAVKNDPATSEIKVVMLTARGQESDRKLGADAGADDYFVKPFSPLDLLGKVEAILGD